ncbi:MAG TPA: hypothetical protein VGN35_07420 [Jatrophihabitantaceae bacterium]|nr:hypothetical protein [Jatrophihabitantaceae bacterium]
MSSSLSGIPIAKRRQLAATIGLFAMLFVAVGLVATTGTTPGVVRIFAGVSIAIAVILALTAWGVMRSVKIEVAEQQLDEAITATVEQHGASMCGCGHDHDPNEMQVRGETCAHDGTGRDCTHDCQTCVLAAMRPDPARSRAARLAE